MKMVKIGILFLATMLVSCAHESRSPSSAEDAQPKTFHEKRSSSFIN